MAQSETQGFQTIWNPPFELVNEFNVLRSSFSAQYGLAQGVTPIKPLPAQTSSMGTDLKSSAITFSMRKARITQLCPSTKKTTMALVLADPVIIPHLYNGKNRNLWHLSMEWYRENLAQTGSFHADGGRKAGATSAHYAKLFTTRLEADALRTETRRELDSAAISSQPRASVRTPPSIAVHAQSVSIWVSRTTGKFGRCSAYQAESMGFHHRPQHQRQTIASLCDVARQADVVRRQCGPTIFPQNNPLADKTYLPGSWQSCSS